MDQLRAVELKLVDDLFGMSSGWVLDFTNATFDDFFRREVGVDVYDDVYASGSGSKGKRFRAFLTVGQPRAIVRALTSLWEYRETGRVSRGDVETVINARARLSVIVERLGGVALPSFDVVVDEPPLQSARPAVKATPDHAALDLLERDFLALYAMADEPHARGTTSSGCLPRCSMPGIWTQGEGFGLQVSKSMARSSMVRSHICSRRNGIARGLKLKSCIPGEAERTAGRD